MSDKKINDEKSSTPTTNDRRRSTGGISKGGRRKSDDAKIAPMGRSSRIWFGLSLILTVLIMIWTFSIPFRTDKSMLSWGDQSQKKPAQLVSDDLVDHPEHLMDSDEYVAYAWEIEADLQDALEEQREMPENLPNAKHAAEKREKRVEKLEAKLQRLIKIEDSLEDGFQPGSMQAEAIERLQQQLESKEH